MARNQLFHLLDQLASAPVGARTMQDQAQRIDTIAVDQHVYTYERTGLEALEMVFHRSVAARYGFELVEEIEHDLGQRQLVTDLHLARHVVDRTLHTALFLA